ncbi:MULTISPECIES: hypothetical protein [unclassified Streptomyces]|uniref:hypothetical protein n=1 Tax=unclassified Streptomyces TaxID=2593676 RepID=UPI0038257804
MSKTYEDVAAQAMYAPTEAVQAEERVASEESLARIALVVGGTGHGQFWFPVTHPAINRNSVVVASITELGFDGSGAFPHPGLARMQISNVVPRAFGGQVDFWLNIDWPNDLAFRVNFQVE